MTNQDNSGGIDKNLNANSFLQDDKVKSEIDKLIVARLQSLMPKNSNTSDNSKSDSKEDDKRKLFLDSIGGALGSVTGGLGDAVGSVTGGVGDAVGGLTEGGGAGLAIGGAAAAAGAMKKAQREKEHAHNMMMVENEMAAAQFSADFQDQAIMELSRAVGRSNFVVGRLNSIHKMIDYSLGHMITDFMEIVY